MAHYRFLCFHSPEKSSKGESAVNREELSRVDGLVYDGEIISLDTIRWMLPELSEEKRRETLQKIIEQKKHEAESNGLLAYITDIHC